jgi:hypothetical protein
MDMTALHINVQVIFDQNASVWVATSTDLPGLIAEAETFEALEHEIRLLLPELVDLNADQRASRKIEYELHKRDAATLAA